jgi:hypothetical protein
MYDVYVCLVNCNFSLYCCDISCHMHHKLFITPLHLVVVGKHIGGDVTKTCAGIKKIVFIEFDQRKSHISLRSVFELKLAIQFEFDFKYEYRKHRTIKEGC